MSSKKAKETKNVNKSKGSWGTNLARECIAKMCLKAKESRKMDDEVGNFVKECKRQGYDPTEVATQMARNKGLLDSDPSGDTPELRSVRILALRVLFLPLERHLNRVFSKFI